LRRKAGVSKSNSGADMGVLSFMAASLISLYDSNMTKWSYNPTCTYYLTFSYCPYCSAKGNKKDH
jgi:hypothetical protein